MYPIEKKLKAVDLISVIDPNKFQLIKVGEHRVTCMKLVKNENTTDYAFVSIDMETRKVMFSYIAKETFICTAIEDQMGCWCEKQALLQLSEDVNVFINNTIELCRRALAPNIEPKSWDI